MTCPNARDTHSILIALTSSSNNSKAKRLNMPRPNDLSEMWTGLFATFNRSSRVVTRSFSNCKTMYPKGGTRSSGFCNRSTTCRRKTPSLSSKRGGLSGTCGRRGRKVCGSSASSKVGRGCGWSGRLEAGAAVVVVIGLEAA